MGVKLDEMIRINESCCELLGGSRLRITPCLGVGPSVIEAPSTNTPNDEAVQGLAIHQLATEPPGPRGGYYRIFGSK